MRSLCYAVCVYSFMYVCALTLAITQKIIDTDQWNLACVMYRWRVRRLFLFKIVPGPWVKKIGNFHFFPYITLYTEISKIFIFEDTSTKLGIMVACKSSSWFLKKYFQNLQGCQIYYQLHLWKWVNSGGHFEKVKNVKT